MNRHSTRFRREERPGNGHFLRPSCSHLRFNSIREKLYSLGYTENDLPGPTDWGFPGEDVWQSITVQPRELTPRSTSSPHKHGAFPDITT